MDGVIPVPQYPGAAGCCAAVTGGLGGYDRCPGEVVWAGLSFGRPAFACAEHGHLLHARDPIDARPIYRRELDRRRHENAYWMRQLQRIRARA